MSKIETLISLGIFFQLICGTNKYLILEDKNIEDSLIKKAFIGMLLTNLLLRGMCLAVFMTSCGVAKMLLFRVRCIQHLCHCFDELGEVMLKSTSF